MVQLEQCAVVCTLHCSAARTATALLVDTTSIILVAFGRAELIEITTTHGTDLQVRLFNNKLWRYCVVHRLRALPWPSISLPHPMLMPMPMLEHIRAAFADKAVRCLALDRRRRSDEPTTVHRWLMFLLLMRCASTRACEDNE